MKRKRDEENEAKRKVLRATAKKAGFDLPESFETDDGTLLKLELQTRTGAKSYYKGVNEARPGVYRVDPKQLAAAGVKLKNNSYETQVGAAKALARSPSPSMAPSPPHLIEPPCR